MQYQINIINLKINIMNANNKLNIFRNDIKECITKELIQIYLKEHNGIFPNFNDEQDFIIDSSNIPSIQICDKVESQSGTFFEMEYINEYIVTLDNNLYVKIGDYNEEMEWTDIYTDDLISILSILEKYNVELNMMINP